MLAKIWNAWIIPARGDWRLMQARFKKKKARMNAVTAVQTPDLGFSERDCVQRSLKSRSSS